MKLQRVTLCCMSCVGVRVLVFAMFATFVVSAASNDRIQIKVSEIEDRIHGGFLGQVIGNLNGLPHEFRYIEEPGNVTGYVPALSNGGRTDDDTDVEWIYLVEMDRSNTLFIPPDRSVALWKSHINDFIWSANDYARQLMDIGLEPPLTGSSVVNPWASTNVAGLFLTESFSLAAPAMPKSAGEMATYYASTVVDGEPLQAAQLFSTMISQAFIEQDVARLIEAGRQAVDPASEVHEIATFVRRQVREHPSDWKSTRRAIRDKYTRYGGVRPDINGYALNTAAVLAALYYGKGDFARTLELSFNMGWDADNSAAMCGTILGVIKGRKWIDQQGWKIVDIYQNRGNRRPGMPTNETISSFAERIVSVAHLALRTNGAKYSIDNGVPIVILPRQSIQVVHHLNTKRAVAMFDPKAIERDLTTGDFEDRARAVYLAVCLGMADRLRADHPDDWRWGVQRLYRVAPGLVVALFTADKPFGEPLRQRALKAGILQPKE